MLRCYRSRGQRERCAFTLVELLVSVMIFIVLSSMLLVNFRRGAKGDAVRGAALTFAGHLERARAEAFGAGSDADVVAYGIHVDRATPDRYVRFGDRATGRRGAFDAGEGLANGVVVLPAGVTVMRMVPDAALDITFAPPLGRVTIAPDATEARVTFANDADMRTVSVNRVSGQVSVE